MSALQAGCFSAFFRRKQVSVSKRTRDPAPQGSHRKGGPPTAVGSSIPPGLKCHHITPCDYSYADASTWWLETDTKPPPILLKMMGFAHDVLTSFMASHGFTVTKNYLGLATAFRAEFQHGQGGRVLGVNSEYDALKSIGHACGHNLIAWSGCGVALAVKAALEAHNVPGKVILLGTPAEEGGGGKTLKLSTLDESKLSECVYPQNSRLLQCPRGSSPVVSALFGLLRHPPLTPFFCRREGTNALDAAFLAYSSISVLRQQIRPDHRVHGVIEGNQDWLPNVIPDYAKMHWLVRAPTSTDLTAFVERVKHCFQAAALATSCEIKLEFERPYLDLNQNDVLGQEFSDVVMKRYGMITNRLSGSASTDFGNVSYALPALHPGFAIPTEPNGGNHTIGFTKAAASHSAHDAALLVTKGLAHTGFRALRDDDFFKQVKASFSS
ncbi:hypothetical protein B0H19DRAFT_1115758 [Mycena capillaripes]|nr:hypothetical protein B0H19DRAFT_1115758 [Mycena capillaripes]